MKTPTNPSFTIEHALLGFVYERPSHGYDIYQQLATSDGLWQVWRIKQSQLYALLSKLEKASYLTATLQEQDARPPRKIYALTESGCIVYQKWLTTPVLHGRQMRLEFLTKLYFAERQDRAIVRQLLEHQIETYQQWLTDLQGQPNSSPDTGFFVDALREFRINQTEPFLTWLATCRQVLPPSADHV